MLLVTVSVADTMNVQTGIMHISQQPLLKDIDGVANVCVLQTDKVGMKKEGSNLQIIF